MKVLHLDRMINQQSATFYRIDVAGQGDFGVTIGGFINSIGDSRGTFKSYLYAVIYNLTFAVRIANDVESIASLVFVGIDPFPAFKDVIFLAADE